MIAQRQTQHPGRDGFFGIYGGRFVAETLMPLVLDVEAHYSALKEDSRFHAELSALQRDYIGRETPLYHAERLSKHLGGAKIYLKREDLNHTGAHKINNCIGQILIAKHMGKTHVIAETGAGMHGVATATVASRFGMRCTVFMGATDIDRQQANVFRMNMLGATVIPVTAGNGTLKDAMNEALRYWVSHVEDTFYIIGTAAGPYPYPEMVRDFQSVIGREVRRQTLEKEGRLPDTLVACIGGGSNAIGLFHDMIDDANVAMVGVEAGGLGLSSGQHAAALNAGRPGILHGNLTYLLQSDDGQILEAHSVSAGLDYPGVGPEHAFYYDSGRVDYVTVNDDEAIRAFQTLCHLEGIIPALESSHALAEVIRRAPALPADHIIVMNLSGRGDKDMDSVAHYLERHSGAPLCASGINQ